MVKKFLLISFSVTASCFAGKEESNLENHRQYQQEFDLRFSQMVDKEAKKFATTMAQFVDLNKEDKGFFIDKVQSLLGVEMNRLSRIEDSGSEEDASRFIENANNFHQLGMKKPEVAALQQLFNQALSEYSFDSDSSQEDE